jgi:Tfp pilus assembly protein PilV
MRQNSYLQSDKTGFSLIEVMVAGLVFALLGALLMQITAAASRSTRFSNQNADAASQARLAFARIGMDLAAIPRRKDVDFLAGNPGATSTSTRSGNYLLYFISGVTTVSSTAASGFTNRGISLVGYQMLKHSDNNGRLCLTRAAKAISWSQTSFMGLESANNYLPMDLTSSRLPSALCLSSSDYDIVAPGVFQVAVGFQLYPDNRSATLANGTTVSQSQGQIVYSPPVRNLTASSTQDYVDVSRISAIVVGVAVLDVENMKKLTADQVDSLASLFKVPNASVLPVQEWASVADNLASKGLAIPLPVLQAVRVYHHCFPITPFAGGAL